MAHSNQSVGLFKEGKREKVVIIYKQRDEDVYFIFSYNGYLYSIQNFKLKALEYVFLLTFYDTKDIRRAYHQRKMLKLSSRGTESDCIPKKNSVSRCTSLIFPINREDSSLCKYKVHFSSVSLMFHTEERTVVFLEYLNSIKYYSKTKIRSISM